MLNKKCKNCAYAAFDPDDHSVEICNCPESSHYEWEVIADEEYCDFYCKSDDNYDHMSAEEFIVLIDSKYNIGNKYFDELLKNVILYAKDMFDDSSDKFRYLDELLPTEFPRKWIRKLSH